MRRVLLITLFLGALIQLCGCAKIDQLKILVPQGSPELAVTYLKAHDNYQVDVVLGADPLLAAFSSQTHDVIIAPTHLGVKLSGSNMEYIMLGIVVFGNYYFASQAQKLEDIQDLNGKDIIIFGQNQTSDIVCKHLFEAFDISANITYVDSVATANAMLILDPNLIILTAEPSLSTLLKSYSSLNYLSMDPYYQMIEGETYPQASVFVKSSLSGTQMKQIEIDFMDATLKLNNDVEISAETAIELGINMEKDVLISAIPRTHIMYQNAYEAKNLLNRYIEMIYALNPMLVDKPRVEDAFLYKRN